MHRVPVEVRFWRYVNKTVSCWLWTAATSDKGYGLIGDGSGIVRAHRLSYESHFGAIPDRMCVLHDCPEEDNPACVNPDHLWLGTQKENMRDMVEKGRSARGARASGAKLSEHQVREIRKLYEDGFSQYRIAEEYDVSQRNISMIVRRKTWTHI